MDNVMYYICYPLGYIMKWCREQVGNYGLAIILFTLVTKLVILPVSVWVHKNSIRMVSIQPQINRSTATGSASRRSRPRRTARSAITPSPTPSRC